MIFKNLKKRLLTSLMLIFLIYLMFNFNLFLVFCLIVFGVLSLLEFFNITNIIFKNRLYFLISNTFFIFYVFTYSAMFFLFSNFLQLKIILFILLFGCIASDVGGFIFGKIFKGPKLTKISPNKTISGAVGSLILSFVVISSGIFYYTKNIDFNIMAVSILTSIACQFGDLFFSFLKRKAKIKDTGSILPGHGGVLDRLDGIYLGVPFGIIIIILFY